MWGKYENTGALDAPTLNGHSLNYAVCSHQKPRCSSSEKSLQYLRLFHLDAREKMVRCYKTRPVVVVKSFIVIINFINYYFGDTQIRPRPGSGENSLMRQGPANSI
jgi:hypothetical protein